MLTKDEYSTYEYQDKYIKCRHRTNKVHVDTRTSTLNADKGQIKNM
jgi:hypothetical protein